MELHRGFGRQQYFLTFAGLGERNLFAQDDAVPELAIMIERLRTVTIVMGCFGLAHVSKSGATTLPRITVGKPLLTFSAKVWLSNAIMARTLSISTPSSVVADVTKQDWKAYQMPSSQWPMSKPFDHIFRDGLSTENLEPVSIEHSP